MAMQLSIAQFLVLLVHLHAPSMDGVMKRTHSRRIAFSPSHPQTVATAHWLHTLFLE